MTWWWSWLLSAAGAASLFIAGTHPRIGWLMGLALQPVWATYAVVSQQWGFLASTVPFTVVLARTGSSGGCHPSRRSRRRLIIDAPRRRRRAPLLLSSAPVEKHEDADGDEEPAGHGATEAER